MWGEYAFIHIVNANSMVFKDGRIRFYVLFFMKSKWE